MKLSYYTVSNKHIKGNDVLRFYQESTPTYVYEKNIVVNQTLDY